jgi:predicted transcriptional regulator
MCKVELMTAAMAESGDELMRILSAMANPHRLRILAALAHGRNYVSQLARDLGISRPLMHLHLQRLEHAGLVVGSLELSEDGKAMKYFDIAPFAIRLTPDAVATAVQSLSDDGLTDGSMRKGART